MKKYIFKKYEKNYKRLFKNEKKRLINIFGKTGKIEHIGSTAVPGLGGKGILDILIAVEKKRIKNIINKLEKKGYILSKTGGSKERLFFEKDYVTKGEKRRIHIHLIPKNSSEWNKSIATRDLLRKNKKLAEEYTKIKRQAVKKCKGKGKIYRECKRKFLERISEIRYP